MKVKLHIEQEIEVDLPLLAKCFAELDDDSQAQFFVEVAKHAQGWKHHQSDQWYRVGRHMSTCECSTQEARDLIEMIHAGLHPTMEDVTP